MHYGVKLLLGMNLFCGSLMIYGAYPDGPKVTVEKHETYEIIITTHQDYIMVTPRYPQGFARPEPRLPGRRGAQEGGNRSLQQPAQKRQKRR
jgi:hypothetical protein